MKYRALSLSKIQPLPHREAWLLAWPMIISNLSVPLMGLADTAMLGHLDNAVFLAAVAIGANIIALFFWMFSFLRMGTTTVTAQAMGANKPEEALLHLSQNTLFALVLGLGLMLFQSLLLPMALWLIAPEPQLLETAMDYCQIRIFSAPAVLITYVATGWLLGQRNAKAPLMITFSANIINVVLDYLFIVHWNMEAKGAAYATLIAEYFACGFSLIVCGLFLHHHKMQIRRWLDLPLLKQNLKLGADLFVRTLALLSVINFFNAQGAQLGNNVLAANAILFQCVLFTSFFLDGYALAAETLTARAIGGKNVQAFYKASAVAFIYCCIIALSLSVFFGLFGSMIITSLTSITLVANIAIDHLPWLIVMPLVSVWCYAFDGIFIGAGQSRIMRNAMLFSVFLGFIPVWWLSKVWGNHGLWLAFTVFNSFRGITLGIAYLRLTLQQNWINENNSIKNLSKDHKVSKN